MEMYIISHSRLVDHQNFSTFCHSPTMSQINIPSSHRALTAVSKPKGYKIAEKALPIVGDDDLLVKVRSVALNP